jgi:transcriptional regulator with XRE-family HTH domain
MTSLDEARSALGTRLREIRTDAGLNGKQLAELLAWPPSKVSKIELGRQTPTDNDLRAWARATDFESVTDELIASLRTLEIQHAEWKRLLKSGLHPHQAGLIQRDENTRRYRVFESTFIPGLLQTPEYARSRFARAVVAHRTPSDIGEAVRTRMQRQEILYHPDRQFHFVLTEAVLRYRLCPIDTMIVQLDRLVSLTALRNLKLGIIRFSTLYVSDPRHGFWLLDDDRVRVETYSAELNLQQPPEIELYASVFEQLAAVASYGKEARAILTQVMDDLAAEAELLAHDFATDNKIDNRAK